MTDRRRAEDVSLLVRVEEVSNRLDGHIEHFDRQVGALVTELVGVETVDPLTGNTHYEGGIRTEIGGLRETVGRLEYQAANGGVNARVKLTGKQRAAVITVAVPSLLAAVVELVKVANGV